MNWGHGLHSLVRVLPSREVSAEVDEWGEEVQWGERDEFFRPTVGG